MESVLSFHLCVGFEDQIQVARPVPEAPLPTGPSLKADLVWVQS